MSARPRRRCAAALAVGAAAWSAVWSAPAAASPLLVDLSEDAIEISTGFSGAELLLFGAKEPGGDVVVVIRGPAADAEIRRRRRVAGVWVNGAARTFRGLPAFYRVLASRPVDEIAPAAALEARRIGLHRLDYAAALDGPADPAGDWRRALVRNKVRQGLYGYRPRGVALAEDRLFRAEAAFPANVPTGAYAVEVYLFDGGREVGRRDSTLVVRKVGMGARLTEFAHRQAALYGAMAIAIALASGWLAGAVFRS